MKSIFYISVLSLWLFSFNQLSAQEKPLTKQTSVSVSEKQKTPYVEKLNLDDEQAQKFEAINNKYEENVKALNIKTKNKKSVKKLKALEEDRDKEIKELLSEEQFKKYIELRHEERNSLKTLIRKSNGQ